MDKLVMSNTMTQKKSVTAPKANKLSKPAVYQNQLNGFAPSHPLARYSPPHKQEQLSANQKNQAIRLNYYHTLKPAYIENPSFGIQDFELKNILGTGTFGKVYLSKFKPTKRFYAMKVLNKAQIVHLKQVDHLLSEKKLLASVKFPFIVDLFCTFQDESSLYMLLEYVVGGELFYHLRCAGRFTNDMARFYASEIVLALEYLHSKDIIYRDLKPENLLIDHEGHIKITDFGFAKQVIARTWTLCGTPEYLAPEIIQSLGHDKAVDWWALGILLFEMLAGYPPFLDKSSFYIYEKILAGKFLFPNHFESLAKDLITRLLISDRSERLGSSEAGSEDVKRHKWFRGVDWVGLLDKSVRAPIVPNYPHPGDTSNFLDYEDKDPVIKDDGKDSFHEMFVDFSR